MAVDSIKRVAPLQIHQSSDTREEREKRQKEKKTQKENSKTNSKDTVNNSAPDEPSKALEGQILDSVKTLELLNQKPLEPATQRNHALIELTQNENVKNLTTKTAKKINKSA